MVPSASHGGGPARLERAGDSVHLWGAWCCTVGAKHLITSSYFVREGASSLLIFFSIPFLGCVGPFHCEALLTAATCTMGSSGLCRMKVMRSKILKAGVWWFPSKMLPASYCPGPGVCGLEWGYACAAGVWCLPQHRWVLQGIHGISNSDTSSN